MAITHTFALKLLILFAGLSAVACVEGTRWNIPPRGKIIDAELTESSGLSASRRFQDVFWTHNDDGKPRLFAINGRGRLIRSFLVPSASNQDWESIALDDEGRIYLLDNTSRIRADRKSVIYVFPEPDPFGKATIESVRKIEVSCDNQPFDLEAMFYWDKRLYLVSKPWDGSNPRTYRVEDLEVGGEAAFVGELPVKAMITGADLAGSGERLALSSYRAVFIFEGNGNVQEMIRSDPRVCRLNAGQAEGIAWVDEDLFLTNEQRWVYRVPKKRWTQHAAPFLKPLEATVPELKTAPRSDQPLKSWTGGLWMDASEGSPITIGRVGWTSQGLHVGVDLPEGWEPSAVGKSGPGNLSHWFDPGLVYLLLNPDGTRPLTYGADDWCVVIGKSEAGGLRVQVRQLGPATFVTRVEEQPDWVRVERTRTGLLLTISSQARGLGSLRRGRRIGFNLLYIDEDRDVVSWTPLTLQYSWDAPSYWGLLEIE